MPQKKSFFERLTGSTQADEYDFEPELDVPEPGLHRGAPHPIHPPRPGMPGHHPHEQDHHLRGPKESIGWGDEPTEELADAELTVDVYQTNDDIIVKTIIAGVRPEDVDVSITRESVTIRGQREESRVVDEEDYFHRELYWGSFSRTISLPAEIDVDLVEATEKNGILMLKLPKINKDRQTKVRVKSL